MPIHKGFRWRGFEGATNYFAPPDRGYDWWKYFLDEMVEHRANILTMFCESATGADPTGFGLGWPSHVPGGHPDAKCLNANSDTEYMSRLINDCKSAGVSFVLRICVMDDWAFVAKHPELRQEQPGIFRRGLCPNKPAARAYIQEKILDLATFYKEADALYFDQIVGKYSNCICPHCRDNFAKTMGITPEEATEEQRTAYHYKVVVELTRKLVLVIKAKVPHMRVGATLEGISAGGMPDRQKYYTQDATELDFLFFQNFTRSRKDMQVVTQSAASVYNKVYVTCSVYSDKVLNYGDYFRGNSWWVPAEVGDPEVYVDMAIEARERLSDPSRFCGFTFWNMSLHEKGDPMRKAAMRAIKRLSTYHQ